MFAPMFLLEYFKIKFCAELNNDEFIDIITIRIPFFKHFFWLINIIYRISNTTLQHFKTLFFILSFI